MLALHQLRVAAVVSVILDNFTGPVHKENVLKAALLHDMGNIVKSNLDPAAPINAQYSAEDLKHWNQVKSEYIAKYGSDAEAATLPICREIGVEDGVLDLITGMNFDHVCDIAAGSVEKKIVKYGDLRVGFFGVLSMRDRIADANVRYNGVFSDELIRCAEQMEHSIFSLCTIQPGDITDDSIRDRIEKLKNYEI